MIQLLEKISEIEKREKNRLALVLTVLDGVFAAEKALVVDGTIVWSSENGKYFCKHKEEISRLSENKTITLGENQVYCDILGKEKELVICGGGHVSIPIITLGKMAGFEVTVLEDRPFFADKAREAGADQVICESFESGLRQVEGNADTYFIIVTRGHRFDQICLEEIVKKEHAYIGMMGSRKRTAIVKQNLEQRGVSKEVLNTVYTPIGLGIGAETPEEIAIAIIAEIIEIKNKKKKTCGYSKDIIKMIMDEKNYASPKVLATIIKRKGSAPRAVGTKMLICKNGTCIGTIGGGLLEAEVTKKALCMIEESQSESENCKDKKKNCIYQINMTRNDAEEEGMVCGGIVDVFLELIVKK